MFSSDKWFGASAGFYNGVATQSLRMDYASGVYLNFTPTSTGDQKTWTWSGWIKRTEITRNNQYIYSAHSGSNYFAFYFKVGQLASYYGTGSNYGVISDMQFRDISQWYHIVHQVDAVNTTQRVWVNGTEITLNSSRNPGNSNYPMNQSSVPMVIGKHSWGTSYFNDMYLAEVNYTDGQKYEASDFGETKNGVWIAKEPSVTYGTNGYRLQFKQTGDGQTTASSTTIGADTSGNNNHYKDYNLDSYDSNMPDSPENNFCVINAIRESTVYNGSVTLSEGNLQSVDAGTTYSLHWTATFGMSTGKWYWEVLAHTMGGTKGSIGICNSLHKVGTAGTGVFYGNNGNREAVTYYTPTTTYGDSYTNGDIIGVAFDADNETVTFYKNNSSQGAVGSVLTTANGEYFPAVGDAQNATTYKFVANFGQDSSFAGNKTAQGNKDGNGNGDFYYSPPSGYLALCSANLPDTTISPNQDEQGSDFNQVVFYDGNSSNSHQITGVGFQPDMVHIKARNQSSSHYNIDSSRGIGTGDSFKALGFNTSIGQYTAENDQLRSLDADGFTLDDNTDNTWYVNRSSDTYVSWNWRVNGGTTSTNNEGTISSTVQVNNDIGMSIALYTAPSGTFYFGHGLSQAPEFFMVKSLGGTGNWIGYHKARTPSIPNTKGLYINSPSLPQTNSNWIQEVSATRIGITTGQVTGTGDYLLYAWHSVDGYCKIGQYEGNGSTDNAFVYTGFLPNIIWIKNVDSGHDWVIRDLKHSGYYTDGRKNPITIGSSHSKNNPHTGGSAFTMDFLSNGFKIRHYDSDIGSSHTFAYIAWASDQTFKFSNAR